MTNQSATTDRVRVDGKFFRAGRERFHVKGVTYGPFPPDSDGHALPDPARVRTDFSLMRELGANTVRLYHPPPRWLLDLASEHGLRLIVDMPVHKHATFLSLGNDWRAERKRVREAVRTCAGHPALFAVCVTNEVPADVARWSGAVNICARVDALIDVAKHEDPDCLCTFANFPSTEYLQPRHIDFLSFNIFLHHRRPFADYLARLQMHSGHRPLLLTEIGVDAMREGETAQAETLGWQIESAFRAGLAGVTVFSFTDEWHTGGMNIEDWAFGLTTRERQPKPSFHAVQDAFRQAPYYPQPDCPRISVVVASHNGAKTLKGCLESLEKLNHPDYEVLLVDDGSTDATPQIMESFEWVRYLPQRHQGLSVARNTGIAAATGELVAFLDADCRADRDWLYYLAGDLLAGSEAGMGGPNLLPPDDSPVAAAVQVSPGVPTHVMLTDREAEHIPGCNMIFRKSALTAVGCFDPVFQRAGDDVDVCWRLHQSGFRIGFSPSAFVWHHRRSTVGAYLDQQAGYGQAEALLLRKHPEYFNTLGGGRWRGRIYATTGAAGVGSGAPIYHGVFATGDFQMIYAVPGGMSLLFCTSLEFHFLSTLPLAILASLWPVLWPLPVASLLVSISVAGLVAARSPLPHDKRRWWSRPLVAMLYLLQPVIRGWARYRGRLGHQGQRPPPHAVGPLPRLDGGQVQMCYWKQGQLDRVAFLQALLGRLEVAGWTCKPDSGWNHYDVEILGSRWGRAQISTVHEPLAQGESLLHVRLRSVWSLASFILFWGGIAGALLLVGFGAGRNPWTWMALLGLPLLGWMLEHENRTLLRHLTAFLDKTGAELGLQRVPPLR